MTSPEKLNENLTRGFAELPSAARTALSPTKDSAYSSCRNKVNRVNELFFRILIWITKNQAINLDISDKIDFR